MVTKRPRSNSAGKLETPSGLSLLGSPAPEAAETPDSPNPKPRKRQRRDLSGRAAIFSKQLLQKPDFTLLCGDVQIRVHSQLLGARSVVFDKMLGGPFQESTDRTTTITDVRPEELIEFLKWFYPRIQNSLKIRRGSVPALLYLAEKYQVDEIKAMCELRIRTEMLKERTVARLAPWLKLAYDYRLRELQSESTARIAKIFPNFDRTPTFRALPPELKLEVIAHSKGLIQDRMKQLRDISALAC